jgi:fructose-1,6-bisphosphatase II
MEKPVTQPTRNLALELVRVTETAALATGRYMGRGDKNAAEKAAVDGMYWMLDTIQMDGVIVIGEGEKELSPHLYNGERLGTGTEPQVDFAVNPIDGARPLALGLGNSISAVALAPRGAMFNPGPVAYMNKIVVGPQAKDVIDIEAPVADNLQKNCKSQRRTGQ